MAQWKLEDWIQRWQSVSNEIGVVTNQVNAVKYQITDMEYHDEQYPDPQTILHRQEHGYQRPVRCRGYNNLSRKT